MLLAPGMVSLWCSRPLTHHLDFGIVRLYRRFRVSATQARYGFNLFPFSCSLFLLLLLLFFLHNPWVGR